MHAPEIFVNPARRRDVPAVTSSGGSPRAFHRRLPGYAPTPLLELPEVAHDLGLDRCHVKVESERLGLPSFKILGASWASYCLLVERLGHEPSWSTIDDLRRELAPLGALTFVAATDGNHGRAVARVAKLLGYAARIFVPAGTADARIEGIESEGAPVTVVDGIYEDAVGEAAQLASDDVLVVSDTSWPGYTEVPRNVIAGYRTIFDEVDEQLAASGSAAPDLVPVQMGVGALTAAVVTHYAASATIAVVEPLHAACGLQSAKAGAPTFVPGPHDSIMAGLNCGSVSEVAWPTIAAGADVFVAVSDAAAEHAMRDLDGAGIVSGETGGAGLAGLRALIDAGTIDAAGRRALVICTEGATDPVAYQRIVGHAP